MKQPQESESPALPRLTVGRPAAFGMMLGIAVAVIGISVVLLFFFNPAQHGFYPRCAFYQLTGWQCPGCGGLRAAHQLLHGHVQEALRLNALAVLALPLAAWWLWRNWARGGAGLRARWVWLCLAALLVFGVVRNLPGFGWLSP